MIEDYLSTRTQMLSATPMKELLDCRIIPRKFAEALEYNQKLRLCCRKVENMTARLFKSDDRLSVPDIFVATCTCGRSHIRVAHDPVRYGEGETEEEKIANARSILNQPFESGVTYE